MFAEDAPDQDAELRPHVLPQRPVDRDVAPDGFDQFAGDAAKGIVAEYLNERWGGLEIEHLGMTKESRAANRDRKGPK